MCDSMPRAAFTTQYKAQLEICTLVLEMDIIFNEGKTFSNERKSAMWKEEMNQQLNNNKNKNTVHERL